jgi:uncharacterized protein YndB with AHSA1/START domain
MTSDRHSVTLVRRIAAAPDAVYAAWTVPDLMRTWFGSRVEADVRVGGRYRIENRDEHGVHVHTGEYLVLEPSRRIVQTFRYEGPMPVLYGDERLTITFRAMGDEATELTLTHSWTSPAASDEDLQALDRGWQEWFDLLDRAVTAASSAPAPRS